jgi:hypothetical protein
MIEQDLLKELLHYCPEHGVFTWRHNGKECGYISNFGYRIIKINNKPYVAHRLAWVYIYGCSPSEYIDHINGCRSDNRIDNLRAATRSINSKNTKKRSDNNSGVMGVSWDKRYNRWQSYLNSGGKRKHLGYFDNIFDAAAARISAQWKHGFHKNHGRV